MIDHYDDIDCGSYRYSDYYKHNATDNVINHYPLLVLLAPHALSKIS